MSGHVKNVVSIHRYFVHIATMCMVEQEHSVFLFHIILSNEVPVHNMQINNI